MTKEKPPLSRQIYSVERLSKLGRAALKKEGATNGEIDMLLDDAQWALKTPRSILPCEDQVRDVIVAAMRASH